jgi:hypothetical protein
MICRVDSLAGEGWRSRCHAYVTTTRTKMTSSTYRQVDSRQVLSACIKQVVIQLARKGALPLRSENEENVATEANVDAAIT